MGPSWSLPCTGGGEGACVIRFPLSHVCPWCGAQPSLACHLSPPPTGLPLQFSQCRGTRGQGTVGFMSPIFCTGDGWPRQEGGGPGRRQVALGMGCPGRRQATPPRPGAPSASREEFSEGPFSSRVQRGLESDSLPLKSTSPSSWLVPPQGFVTVTSAHPQGVTCLLGPGARPGGRVWNSVPCPVTAFTPLQPITRWRA